MDSPETNEHPHHAPSGPADTPHSPGAPAQAAESGAENVDKIRDILFGSNMREYEQRFAAMEERLSAEIKNLRSDSERRLDKLEEFLTNRVNQMQQSLQDEKRERGTADQDLGNQLRGAKQEVDQALGQLRDDLNRKSEAAAQELHTSFKDLMQHVGQVRSELGEQMSRESAQLNAQKVGRDDLSVLLTNLAMNLASDQSTTPSGD